MSDIKSLDIMLIDELFETEGSPGYVLNFNNVTFTQFFRQEMSIDIDDPKYAAQGTSKGKRLRYFLQTVENETAVKALEALWNYRRAIRLRAKQSETVLEAEGRFQELIGRLGGKPVSKKANPAQLSNLPANKVDTLSQKILALSSLAPQKRGYEFEKFLKELFDAYGLEGRSSFRQVGEQIDGSFQLGHETYLVEAKWQATLTGVTELHGFQGKIGTKAAWSRGVFISYTGFSEDGLAALGTGIRTICMDGRDLYDMISKNLRLDDVLSMKVRRAAETGKAFVRVCDLFPS